MNNGPRVQYSENQAAKMLGVTVDELRGLVRDHIVKDPESVDPPLPSYQSTDLLVLRILARMTRPVEIAHA